VEALTSKDFPRYFEELWGHAPFPWQSRLLEMVSGTGWPSFLDLPTASGKTAALDVAVFALALEARKAPEERRIGRRIFFVVNRRVIVDEAFVRAQKLVDGLFNAKEGTVIHRVAQELRRVSGDKDAPPLDAALMRGGIVRDNRWARSITQPTIVTSTIDQVGSRLLFRGYGVSDCARPLHASLIAHDSLLLLDEAHISQPFVDTLKSIQKFRGVQWAKTPVQAPFAFVQLTATPGETESDKFTLDVEDLAHPVLRARHTRPKPTALRVATGAKGKNPHPALAKALAEEAVGLLSEERRNIAIVVNRVATARQVAKLLPNMIHEKELEDSTVHLAIGRMRPIDRDELTTAIAARVGPASETFPNAAPMFVVATQCLEVGADFDFDAMVSECASIDALRQRFGRLNRRGRHIETRGVIVIRADQDKEGDDPIYGSALYSTWRWLQTCKQGDEDTVDFGIHTMSSRLEKADITALLAPRLHAPILFPAYIDAWAQTSPSPTPDPDVSLFIHGPERGEPEVQVCWRDDLEAGEEKNWVQVVSLLPPTSPECMGVPIGIVQRWMQGQDAAPDERGDLLDGKTEDDSVESAKPRYAVLWRGTRDSMLAEGASELRPGDTVLVPTHAEGWELFGHIPPQVPRDRAEEARLNSTGMISLRMRPELLDPWLASDAAAALKSWLTDPEQHLRASELRNLLGEIAQQAPDKQEFRVKAMVHLARNDFGFEYIKYPDERGAVFYAKRAQKKNLLLPAMDDGDDRGSAQPAAVPLDDHLLHVTSTIAEASDRLPVAPWREALENAARWHDIGKADERFQAMLLRGNINAVYARSTRLAKSDGLPMSQDEWSHAASRCGYPKGFRHEMLSVQLVERMEGDNTCDRLQRDLLLHLIAAHHGYGRPFAPVVLDDAPPAVELETLGKRFTYSAEERRENPPHRLDSGIAERFWKLTRHFGWWGLAYLEAVLRLADQRASQREVRGQLTDVGVTTEEVKT